MTCPDSIQGFSVSPPSIFVNVIISLWEVLWNMSGVKVTLQIEMKLTYIEFKSLVGGGGDEGKFAQMYLGPGLEKSPLFLPGWPR